MKHISFCFLLICATAAADEFDRFEGKALIAASKGENGDEHARLTLAELGDSPIVLKGTRRR